MPSQNIDVLFPNFGVNVFFMARSRLKFSGKINQTNKEYAI